MSMQIETEDDVKVGAVGDLAVPAEDVGGDYDDGEDLDTATGVPAPRKPDRHEWVTLFLALVHPCRLLAVKKEGSKTYAQDYYVVPKESGLRKFIPGEVRPFKVIPYYSWDLKRVDLLVTPAAEPRASGWGDSMLKLLGKSAEWHLKHQVNIKSNKEAGRYDIKFDPIPGEPVAPSEPTGDLLGAALAGKWITSKDHPVFRSLLKGEVLS